MEYQVFLCIFQKNSAMATLGLKEMGNFLWEGREKVLPSWLSQFSFAKVHLENAKKVWYYEKWVGRHASFPPRQSVKWLLYRCEFTRKCSSILIIPFLTNFR